MSRYLLGFAMVVALGCAAAPGDEFEPGSSDTLDEAATGWSEDARVRASCVRAVGTEVAADACGSRVAFARSNPTRLIDGCADYTDDEPGFFDCLDLVMDLQLTRVVLDDCDQITISADEFLACIGD